jgi:hypothetical protein
MRSPDLESETWASILWYRRRALIRPRSRTKNHRTLELRPTVNYEAFFGQATTFLFSITHILELPG